MPYGVEAQEADKPWRGGKLDDTAVLVLQMYDAEGCGLGPAQARPPRCKEAPQGARVRRDGRFVSVKSRRMLGGK